MREEWRNVGRKVARFLAQNEKAGFRDPKSQLPLAAAVVSSQNLTIIFFGMSATLHVCHYCTRRYFEIPAFPRLLNLVAVGDCGVGDGGVGLKFRFQDGRVVGAEEGGGGGGGGGGAGGGVGVRGGDGVLAGGET